MIDKLKMEANPMDKVLAKVMEICPAAVQNGKIDFDRLREELGGAVDADAKESYDFTWVGKRKAIVKANEPINKTLRPVPEESKNWETTENLYIEGDNLDVLKLLEESYLGKVKLIYIDPPYNTGRNLIYKNDFSASKKEFLENSEQIDEGGSQLVSNPRTNGRFHSDWLSMMYPRLKVCKNMLAKDGVFVCAIDENEFSPLSFVLKEIFGEDGYEHSYVSVVHNPRGQQGVNFSYVHETWVFIYPSDNKKYLSDFPKAEVDSRNLRDSGTESDRTDARSCFYPFIVKNEKIIKIGEVPSDSFHPASANVMLPDSSMEIWPISDSGEEKKWRYARQSVEKILDKLEPKSGRNTMQIIFNKDLGTMRSVWNDSKYDASEYGTKLVEKMLGVAGFTYPKSLYAVYDAVFAATNDDKNAIILDFFSGSATTAHAVMELNAKDGGKRKFIMVQYPEKIEGNVEYKNICEIGKERIRRAGEKIKADVGVTAQNLDTGFRVLKLDESNMRDNAKSSPAELQQQNLLDMVDNVKDDRSALDLLFGVMIDWGVSLSLPIVKHEIDKNKVYVVGDNDLAVCFDRNVSEETIRWIAGLIPTRVVFRDSSFERDDAKINAIEIFKAICGWDDKEAQANVKVV